MSTRVKAMVFSHKWQERNANPLLFPAGQIPSAERVKGERGIEKAWKNRMETFICHEKATEQTWHRETW